MNGKDKARIQRAFGDDYSIDNINKRLYSSRQIIFKPLLQELSLKNILKTIKFIKEYMDYFYIIVIY